MTSTPIGGELMDLFVEETRQMIAEMRQGLATLAERQDSDDVSATQKVLVRCAHTIAGSSGMAGFDDLQELARGLEQVLRKQAEAREVDVSLLQPLSEAIDACEYLLNGERIDHTKALNHLAGATPEGLRRG